MWRGSLIDRLCHFRRERAAAGWLRSNRCNSSRLNRNTTPAVINNRGAAVRIDHHGIARVDLDRSSDELIALAVIDKNFALSRLKGGCGQARGRDEQKAAQQEKQSRTGLSTHDPYSATRRISLPQLTRKASTKTNMVKRSRDTGGHAPSGQRGEVYYRRARLRGFVAPPAKIVTVRISRLGCATMKLSPAARVHPTRTPGTPLSVSRDGAHPTTRRAHGKRPYPRQPAAICAADQPQSKARRSRKISAIAMG